MMIYKPDKQLLSAVLHTDIKEITRHHHYWLITGEAGSWLAKPIRDRKHVNWWKKIDTELRDRGFHAMPRIQQIGNWVLSDYIEGESCKYLDQGDLTKIIKTLAQFHLLGQQLDTPPIYQAAYLLSDRLYERLNGFYRHLAYNHQVEKKLETLLVDYGPIFYKRGYHAYDILCRHGLNQFANKAFFSHMLTHRDLASHNWIKDVSGDIWLIDFETADYDLQVGDLWQICSRILTEHHWDFKLFTTLIEEYERVKSLTIWEKRILATLCGFPNEFFRELLGLLEQKPGYKLEQSLPYLQKIVIDYPVWINSVQQIKEWLR